MRAAETYRAARRNFTLRVAGTTWRGTRHRYVPAVGNAKASKPPKVYAPNGKRECERRGRQFAKIQAKAESRS